MAEPSPPTTVDGRNLDPELAPAIGEAAQIEVETPGAAWPLPPEVTPATTPPPAETYYELPVIKPAPWKWFVPAYFYAGGVAGAAAVLAAAIEHAGDRDDRLARTLHVVSAAGDAIGGALLIADLGRPARFHHMLRVLRPSSPMNVGTWILTASGTSSAVSAFERLVGRRGPTAASTVSALAGAALATYTGVLIGNTAVPIWNVTRRRVPPWFAASAAAGLGSLLELVAPASPVTRVFATAGKTAELIGARAVERAADAAGVAQPLRTGASSAWWRASKWLGAASLVATAWPSRHRARSVIAGALGTAAAIAARFAIVEAGRASAADPRATFDLQRRGQ